MNLVKFKNIIIKNLSDDLLSKKWLDKKNKEINCHPTFGHCYVATEAAFHLLGGKRKGWRSFYLDCGNDESHWFLKHQSGFIFDVTAKQFNNVPIEYTKARGMGFLTKKPSKRARKLIYKIKKNSLFLTSFKKNLL